MSSPAPERKPGPPLWVAALWPAFLVAFAGTATLLGILNVGASFDCPASGGSEGDPLGLYSVTFFVLWAVGALSALAAILLGPGHAR